MKNLFKILVVLVCVVNFVSCTENQEIATENGSIINTEQFGIDKGNANPTHGEPNRPDEEGDEE